MFSKNIMLDAIDIGERKIFPIVSLKINYVNNSFLSMDYGIVAFKIMENDKTYWVNNNLSKKELKKIKKLVEEKY